MNKQANLIMNILIILLIVALVFVMMNYYTDTNSNNIPTNESEIQNEIILPAGNNESIITNDNKVEENRNDTIINVDASGEINTESGENPEVVDTNPPKTNETPKQNNAQVEEKKPVIMTSENEISSKEKKEILTELDKTLMELLDVVDKVQTVDETRLIVDDSEVQ